MTHPIDEARSLEIAKQIKSKAQKPFDNAYKAALAIEGAHYVQGFLVVRQPTRILEHGWLTFEESIIDPNLAHLKKQPQDLYYFPAQSLTAKQLKATIEEAKEDYPEDDPLPVYGKMPYEYYGEVMLGGKDYLKAYQAAEEQYKALNQQGGENGKNNV